MQAAMGRVRQFGTIREEPDIFFGWPSRRKRHYGRNEILAGHIVVLSSQEEETRSSIRKSKLTVNDAKRLIIDASMTPQSRFTPKGPSAGMIDNVTEVDHASEVAMRFLNNLIKILELPVFVN